VSFLNVIGVEWPYVNEDSVLQFASLVHGFGSAVHQTHEDATGAVARFGHAYQGASTHQMASGWTELGALHKDGIPAESVDVRLLGSAARGFPDHTSDYRPSRKSRPRSRRRSLTRRSHAGMPGWARIRSV
jgi:hypothetical protein